jgi:putative ABC transport system substrate-binding protein
MVSMVSSEATAQSVGRVPRVGVLGEGLPTDTLVVAFREALRELGYVEGQSIIVEVRDAHNNPARFPDLVTELIGEKIDVLLVGGTVAARSARAQTATVPIVFTLAGDPVGSGLVASLARPGGNVTGLSNLGSDLGGKQLELLKAALPKVSRVAVNLKTAKTLRLTLPPSLIQRADEVIQ